MQVLLGAATLFFCCCIRLSRPGFQDLDKRLSGPRFQDPDRPMHATHPTVVLFFSRHFSLRPVVTDRRTDYVIGHRQTHGLRDFIYVIDLSRG
jgi:hypothetical protein